VALEGTALDEPGRAFLRALRPGGVLLRDVNIESLPQVRGLVQQVKEAVGLGKGLSSLPLCAVLPDEGRVDRFGEADAPSPAQLGETWDAVKVREAGMVFGAACAQRGISVVFAPVLDVYEPGCAFPGIERASFGEDRDLVTAMGLAMADGLMEAGVVPVAKHYPGMGAARRPEGGGLFVIERDIPQLAELIYPFAEAVAQGIPGILVEHTAVPMLEQGPSESAHATPASMSSALIGRVLRENLHFRGVVVAGDLASKVLQGVRSAEEASVAALVAGCDALIYAEAEPKRIHAICEVIETAVREGVLTEERLAASRQRLDAWQTWLEHPHGLRASAPPSEEIPPNTVKTRYTVAPGDTLDALAKRAHASVDELMGWNSLESDKLKPGMELVLYERLDRGDEEEVEPGSLPPGSIEYTYKVRPGDALFDVARDFGVSAADIRTWNALSDSELREGQILRIYVSPEKDVELIAAEIHDGPKAQPPADLEGKRELETESEPGPEVKPDPKPAPAPTPGPETTSRAVVIHEVQPGESLGRIAGLHGVRRSDIIELNNITDPDKILIVRSCASPNADAVWRGALAFFRAP